MSDDSQLHDPLPALRDEIRHKAAESAGYACAFAVLQLADATDRLAAEVKANGLEISSSIDFVEETLPKHLEHCLGMYIGQIADAILNVGP